MIYISNMGKVTDLRDFGPELGFLDHLKWLVPISAEFFPLFLAKTFHYLVLGFFPIGAALRTAWCPFRVREIPFFRLSDPGIFASNPLRIQGLERPG